MKHLQLALLLVCPFMGNAQKEYNPNAPLGSYSNHFRFDSVSIHFAFNSDWVHTTFKNGRLPETFGLSDMWSDTVILNAYTDTVGDQESNLRLAEMRLNAVKKALPKEMVVLESHIIGEDLSARSDQDKRRVDVLAAYTPYKNRAPKPVTREIPKVELGVPIPLKIVFEGGTPNILEESYPEIDRLLEIMKSDATLKVQLNGHVCCENDMELSVKRARAVKSVLMSNGIAEDRMSTEGFGNTQPLFPDDSEEHHHRNRRVEAVFSR